MIRIAVAFVFSLTLLSPARCRGAAGDFDRSFGDGGGVSTEIGEYAIAEALARQPDGKLLAAGSASDEEGEPADVALVRYLPDGALDTAFGNAGITRTSLGTLAPRSVAVLLQSTGKVVVVARANAGSNDHVALLRYDADGRLDASFGTGGIVITTLGEPGEQAADAVLDDSDGIVVAADTSMLGGPTSGDVLVLHYDAAGVLDPGFGTGGVATVHFGGARDDAAALVREPDGHLVVAGFTWADATDQQAGTTVALARLDATGALDPGFGTAGIVLQPVGHEDEPEAMVRLADGRLVVLCRSFSFVGNLKGGPPFLLRFDTAGGLDTGFGVGGVAWPAFAPALPALVAGGGERVVAVGYAAEQLFNYGFAIARYDGDGSLDPTFGDAGWVVSLVGKFTSLARAALAEPDGRVVAAGYDVVNAPASQYSEYGFGVARFLTADAPCASDADCGACEACGPNGTCTLGPRQGCVAALPRAARLVLDKPLGEVDRYRLAVRWRGAAVPPGFDPSTTDAGVCLYAAGRRYLRTVAPAGGSCGSKPCWRAKPGSASYRDKTDRTPDGIEKLKLSRASASMTARGPRLADAMHALPDPGLLGGRLPVVVQTHLGASCLEARFSSLTGVFGRTDDGAALLVGERGVSD